MNTSIFTYFYVATLSKTKSRRSIYYLLSVDFVNSFNYKKKKKYTQKYQVIPKFTYCYVLLYNQELQSHYTHTRIHVHINSNLQPIFFIRYYPSIVIGLIDRSIEMYLRYLFYCHLNKIFHKSNINNNCINFDPCLPELTPQ